MQCPQCGNRTSVTNSRAAGRKGATDPRNASIFLPAKEAVAWYTWDFVARQRVCKACDWRASTVEVTVDDLYDMLEEAKAGHYRRRGVS